MIFGRGEEKATASTFQVEVQDGAPADLVHLMPMGECVPNDGRAPWKLDGLAHAQAVVDATRRRLGNRDFNFDYDHQAVTAPKAGGTATAAGWAKPEDIFADERGIWARGVQWTRAAAARLTEREYRYISPVFLFEKGTRRVTQILNAALTNNPALDLMAVAAQSHEGDHQDMKAIAQALGLADDAGEDQILTSISVLKTSTASAAAALGLADSATGEELATAASGAASAKAALDTALPALRTTFDLAADADVEAIAAAASDLKAKAAAGPDPSRFVPIEELAAANAKLDSINTEKGEAEVDAAIASGKLTPANREWGLQCFRLNPEGFAAAMGNQPVVLNGGEERGGGGGGTGEALTEEERGLCASLGWSEADILAARKTEGGAE